MDFDVLDEAVMPAVDSPGKPGFSFDELSRFIAALTASGRIAGADFAIYDHRARSGAQICRPAGRLHRRRHRGRQAPGKA